MEEISDKYKQRKIQRDLSFNFEIFCLRDVCYTNESTKKATAAGLPLLLLLLELLLLLDLLL